MYASGELTVGTGFSMLMFTEILFRPLEQLTAQMEDFQLAGASIGRIDELRQTESVLGVQPVQTVEPVESPNEPPSLSASGALRVTFDDVSFGYDPDEPVLTDVSLDIASGKVAGLLGRTGSGKMTISRLLFRPAS